MRTRNRDDAAPVPARDRAQLLRAIHARRERVHARRRPRNDPAGNEPVRTVTLPTNLWCQGAATDTNLVFDVVVADRAFKDQTVTPTNRATDGEWTVRSWVGVCPSS